jgi:hypothetical protein
MTPLRQRMPDAMQLRGLAVRTQQADIAATLRAGLPAHPPPEHRAGPGVACFI